MQYASGTHLAKGHKSGTHRVVSPRETLARVQPYLAPMGITRVANVTGLDTIGIPVVMACRPNARCLAVSQGKGLDLDAARASAVMESVDTAMVRSPRWRPTPRRKAGRKIGASSWWPNRRRK